ncbi:Clp protease N-terminal domain-containing protein [Streptomyces albipurpureus]|uniref:Clp protease n=1 Tax=Streptomyces albipurpureus TaxID=2897419 RepID=A0ABT0UK96_9ACTN|nr:Clp protease N-terminal domain-containing protein [Streptomyces sp. CWNU-1]MCM2388923.1 Clp protease [Streptomyces sp. CWNU-1]
MTAFDKYLHAVIVRAVDEAREGGSTLVEAHHLLLSIAADQEAVTHQILASVGLDHAGVRDALDREFEHSLSTVGVSLTAYDLPAPSPSAERPKIGASAKLALDRMISSVARKKDLRPPHVLLGVLQAQVGKVPRALARAGIDQAALVARVLQALDDDDGGQ